ncbi:MarR family transcriptional regulator [Paenibacillus sp. LMG 31456]|uniref:MarR family transcriptional regulator n=1 Tax=Paenibacillus foliorum TaxID=2654974 RepID=A0A972GSH5_9BACL|nr:MarR family transcriptional regulator [Paenibacillus foliorum]NOU95518.1 MarR family transcriptional regulator [Paenibacillus foliorum]
MEDYQLVAYKFREIKNTLTSFLTQVLPHYQISPIMMYTLEFLRKHPECRAIDLANEFGLTRGAVTQLLDRLELQGLVVRKPHPTSRRSLHIHITEKGYERLDAIIHTYNNKIEQLFTNYSSEELAKLRELLSKMSL